MPLHMNYNLTIHDMENPYVTLACKSNGITKHDKPNKYIWESPQAFKEKKGTDSQVLPS